MTSSATEASAAVRMTFLVMKVIILASASSTTLSWSTVDQYSMPPPTTGTPGSARVDFRIDFPSWRVTCLCLSLSCAPTSFANETFDYNVYWTRQQGAAGVQFPCNSTAPERDQVHR